MTRRESRENAFRAVFSIAANEDNIEETISFLLEDEESPIQTDEFCSELVQLTFQHLNEIDRLISDHLKGWTIKRIPKTSLAVLRISTAQLLYMRDLSENIIINEAVELAKLYGSEEDYAFVNGALRGINLVVRSSDSEQGE